jgi:hypothetical protein
MFGGSVALFRKPSTRYSWLAQLFRYQTCLYKDELRAGIGQARLTGRAGIEAEILFALYA